MQLINDAIISIYDLSLARRAGYADAVFKHGSTVAS